MSRFKLNIYEKRKPKGKVVSGGTYDRPMAARQSKAAKEAVYYEIMDIIDKRIIETKKEVNNGG
jgi:hypothetical protein